MCASNLWYTRLACEFTTRKYDDCLPNISKQVFGYCQNRMTLCCGCTQNIPKPKVNTLWAHTSAFCYANAVCVRWFFCGCRATVHFLSSVVLISICSNMSFAVWFCSIAMVLIFRPQSKSITSKMFYWCGRWESTQKKQYSHNTNAFTTIQVEKNLPLHMVQ